MAKSQLFKPPMQWIYTHGGVFPVRRGFADEEAFITARSDPRARRQRSPCTARAGARAPASCRSRRGRASAGWRWSRARRSCRSRSTAPRRCATGSALQFPKVTILYGDPIRWERVERADARAAAGGRGRDLRRDPQALRAARRGRPPRRACGAAARAATGVTEVLRAGVLEGVRAHVPSGGEAVAARFEALGGDDLAGRARRARVRRRGAFASAAGPMRSRRSTTRGTRSSRPRSTRLLILLLAPPPGDAHAEAARAGLENLARTLSIEWARLGIRPVAIHPARRRRPERSRSSPPSSPLPPARTTQAAASTWAGCGATAAAARGGPARTAR